MDKHIAHSATAAIPRQQASIELSTVGKRRLREEKNYPNKWASPGVQLVQNLADWRSRGVAQNESIAEETWGARRRQCIRRLHRRVRLTSHHARTRSRHPWRDPLQLQTRIQRTLLFCLRTCRQPAGAPERQPQSPSLWLWSSSLPLYWWLSLSGDAERIRSRVLTEYSRTDFQLATLLSLPIESQILICPVWI